MRNCVQTDETAAEEHGGVSIQRLFDEENGCGEFAQRVVRVRGSEPAALGDDSSDEVLYVLEGRGMAAVAGARHALEAGSCLHVPRGAAATLEADAELHALSVLVRDPEPSQGTGAGTGSTTRVDRGDAQRATAGRQFALGVGPEQGCTSATQFVGFVPPGRAPDHFHRYDEVVYVLEGEGTLHVDGEGDAPLRPGSAVHLPATIVHSLENAGPSELHLLGVFRPAGSPAEAYYPDGTLASVPEGE